MTHCPICRSIEHFCEDINIRKGEVEGYHCTACGYSRYEIEIEIELNKEKDVHN